MTVIKTFCIMYTVAMLVLVFVWLGASADGPTKTCVEWETVYPTPTPIPMSAIYSEWIPVPGTAPGTGHGWIRATEFASAQKEWPPTDILTGISCLLSIPYWLWQGVKEWGWSKTE